VGSGDTVYISEDVVLSNADIDSSRVVEGPIGPQIEIVFTHAGAKKFAAATENNIGEPLGVLVNGRLISAPIVHEKISGRKAIIEGSFSEVEAQLIANGIAPADNTESAPKMTNEDER